MPIWLTGVLRYLGLTSDSSRPNTGALIMLGGLVLLAMGYSPEETQGIIDTIKKLAETAVETVTKLDNAGGIAALALGWRMSQAPKPAA